MTARVRGSVRIKGVGAVLCKRLRGLWRKRYFIVSEKDFLFRVILSAVEGSRSMAWEVIWLEELKKLNTMEIKTL